MIRNNFKRQIVLDTETTGINMNGIPYKGHRIIEIGAIEIINRRFTNNNFHVYLNPNRSIDPNAFKIHGISNQFLKNKPSFKDISNKFLKYIKNSELIIHNAAFDVGFINYEFKMINSTFLNIQKFCNIIDTLAIARKIFPGKRNNLDALCTRYCIDNSKRNLHGALLDAQILADIFLLMTGGQHCFSFTEKKNIVKHKFNKNLSKLRILKANFKEIKEHQQYLNLIKNKYGMCLWKKIEF